MKSYEEYVKLRERAASESALNGKVDRKLMVEKAQAFNAYKQECREAAKRGEYIKNGKPEIARDVTGRILRDDEGKPLPKIGPPKKSLQEEYVRKLSDQRPAGPDGKPIGKSPRQMARERLGV